MKRTTGIRTWELLARLLLLAFGLGLLAFGGYLAWVNVESNWPTAYGIGAGAVAASLGLALITIALGRKRLFPG